MSLTLSVPCIHQLDRYVGFEINTQVRISTVDLDPDGGGRFTKCFEMDDASGFIVGKYRGAGMGLRVDPACPFDAQVQGKIHKVGDVVQFEIKRLTKLARRDVDCATGLLRQRWCPQVARPHLTNLARFEQSLTGPMRTFMREMIQGPFVDENLLTLNHNPEGRRHFDGGLLVGVAREVQFADRLASFRGCSDRAEIAVDKLGCFAQYLCTGRPLATPPERYSGQVASRGCVARKRIEQYLETLRASAPKTAAEVAALVDFWAEHWRDGTPSSLQTSRVQNI